MQKPYALLKTLICLQLLICICLGQLSFPSGVQNIKNADKDSQMTLYYEFNDDNKTVRMGLDMPQTVDYFAIGFAEVGKSGMDHFDIVAFIFAPDKTSGKVNVTITDLYAAESGYPPSDISIGGTSDYNLIDYYVTGSRTQVLFDRKLNTGDQYDYAFDKNTAINTGLSLSWAWVRNNGPQLAFHNNDAGTIQFKMDNSNKSELTFKQIAYIFHKYGLLFCWVILIEVAIQYGRYQKHSSHACTIHRVLTTIIYLYTAASAITVLVLTGIDTSDRMGFIHCVIALIILSLSTIQVIGGGILGVLMTGKSVARKIPLLTRLHFFSGTTLYIITKAEVAIGVYIAFGINIMAPLLFLYGFVLAMRVLQEISLKNSRPINEKNINELDKADSELLKHRQLMDLLNRNVPVPVILETPGIKGMKWAMLDDKVFEIKDFDHPGGNFIMELITGREVGRFIYGAYGLEIPGSTKQHSHSKNALLAMQRNFIGTIKSTAHILGTDHIAGNEPNHDNSENLVKSFDDSLVHSEGLKNKLLNPVQMNKRWALQNRTVLASSIAKFEFASTGNFVNTAIYDIKNLGKHLKVSHANHLKVRLYTLVLSQTEQRAQKRASLMSQLSETEKTLAGQFVSARSETIPLVVKNYQIPDQDTFSSFLHRSTIGTRGFLIEGPYGPGFGLTNESTGLHYVFAAGTGIFPFLDLFDFLLESVIDPTSTTNIFKNGFRLHVIAGFAQLNNFIGLEMCQQLVQACKAKGIPDAFKLTLRVKGLKATEYFDVVETEFDNAFIAKIIDRKCVKVFVCGPPKLNELVPSSLQNAGIHKDSIDVV